MATNLDGPFELTRLAAADMVRAGWADRQARETNGDPEDFWRAQRGRIAIRRRRRSRCS
jgi:NAD(P)-dependent dehydrogenase (short-subunit alcohol dehydrogenase family)